MQLGTSRRSVLLGTTLAAIAPAARAQRGWEPMRPVQFVVPAGTGGGADQMARVIQGIVSKHALMKQPMVVVNKAGGAGAEGFLEAKGAHGNPHMLVITLSNLFTTPLATGVPFNWKDLTPVTMMALDEFVLWVKADSPWKTVVDFVAAAKDQRLKLGGTGSKQEDQIITAAIERSASVQFTYLPFRGGGEVAVQLASGIVDATVNNPVEAVAPWRNGKVRPLCVFSRAPLPYTEKIVAGLAWSAIPTCASQGLDVEYRTLRALFLPPGMEKEQLDFYVGLLQKARETPEWQALMRDSALEQDFVSGAALEALMRSEESAERERMREAGLLDER
jgi:tripartite-type tricarboxylate transporter receptor subunit TctC